MSSITKPCHINASIQDTQSSSYNTISQRTDPNSDKNNNMLSTLARSKNGNVHHFIDLKFEGKDNKFEGQESENLQEYVDNYETHYEIIL